MENLEFEFIDRAITLMKEGYGEEAAQLIRTESELNQVQSRIFMSMILDMQRG